MVYTLYHIEICSICFTFLCFNCNTNIFIQHDNYVELTFVYTYQSEDALVGESRIIYNMYVYKYVSTS